MRLLDLLNIQVFLPIAYCSRSYSVSGQSLFGRFPFTTHVSHSGLMAVFRRAIAPFFSTVPFRPFPRSLGSPRICQYIHLHVYVLGGQPVRGSGSGKFQEVSPGQRVRQVQFLHEGHRPRPHSRREFVCFVSSLVQIPCNNYTTSSSPLDRQTSFRNTIAA